MARRNKAFGVKEAVTGYMDARVLGKLIPVVDEHPMAPERTTLLVLDMNYVCAHPDYGIGAKWGRIGLDPTFYYDRIESTVIPNIQRLLEVFRENGLKVVYTRMGTEKRDLSDLTSTWRKAYRRISYDKALPGTKEWEIREEIRPREGEPVLLKRSSGAFASTPLAEVVRGWGSDTLVITGVETDCCIYNTAVEANDRGFKCIVLDDACTTLTKTGHEVFLHAYGRIFFFNVRSTESVIAEIKKKTVARAVA